MAESIDDLRKRVRGRVKAASDKIRRNADKGVFLERSQFDPRNVRDNVGRMNRRQLTAYMRRLDAFVDRKNQFVSGSDGEPLPAERVRLYRDLERFRNKRVAAHAAGMDDIYIPASGMTVAQRNKMLELQNFNVLRAGGDPTYRPYNQRKRKIENIANAAALEKLIKAEAKAMMPSAIAGAIDAQKQAHIDYLERHSQQAMADMVRGLTRHQFDVLKNQTDYARKSEAVYLGAESGDSESWAAQVRDDTYGDMAEMIEWASKL